MERERKQEKCQWKALQTDLSVPPVNGLCKSERAVPLTRQHAACMTAKPRRKRGMVNAGRKMMPLLPAGPFLEPVEKLRGAQGQSKGEDRRGVQHVVRALICGTWACIRMDSTERAGALMTAASRSPRIACLAASAAKVEYVSVERTAAAVGRQRDGSCRGMIVRHTARI